MNLWNLYFFGVYVKWIESIQRDFMKWQVVPCKGREFPVAIIIKQCENIIK